MKLSKPEDMDGIDDEMTPNAAGYGPVRLFGEELPFDEAVRVLASVVSSPGDFGLVSEDRAVESEQRVDELEVRVSQLEEINESLRRDLAILWESLAADAPGGERVIPDDEGMGIAPESVDVYDPTKEFE